MFYEERTTKSEKIYEGRIINLRVDTVELPNMSYAHREIVEHPNCVLIVPFKDEDTLYMIKQYRKAINKTIIEFPAGFVDDDEDPRQAALRELQEEIGFSANELDYVSEVYSSPGFTDEKIDIFIAKDLYDSKLKADDDEYIEVIEVKIDDLEDMLISFELQDSTTVIGALLVLNQRKKND